MIEGEILIIFNEKSDIDRMIEMNQEDIDDLEKSLDRELKKLEKERKKLVSDLEKGEGDPHLIKTAINLIDSATEGIERGEDHEL